MAVCFTQYAARHSHLWAGTITDLTATMTSNPLQSTFKQSDMPASCHRGYGQQQGMALLTILLLVVAITIVAGSMLANQRVMLREFALTKGHGQYKEYALAGESFAANLIAQDSQVNQVDSLIDSWAKPIAEQTINQATLTIQIDDDASLFNLNNLYHDGKVDDTALAFFKALLQANGLSPNIAMAVLDWQDPDSDTRPEGGAEADYYQSTGKKMAMTIANQPFISVDELQYVRGMDVEGFNKIKPYLTAVPYYLPMNINTVKPQLLSVLVNLPKPPANTENPQNLPASVPASNDANSTPTSQIDTTAIVNWANARANSSPIQHVTELWTLPIFANIDPKQQSLIAKLLDTQSQSFQVFVRVVSDDKQLFLHSQIAKILPQSGNAQPPASGVATLPPSNTLTNQLPQIIPYNRQFSPVGNQRND